MNTKLISITDSVIHVDGRKLTPEELIVYTARVSAPQNQENLETSPKLLKYLIQHKHWSPLEMVTMGVEIQTSRAISQQILRHKSFNFQEFSQRYSETSGQEYYAARQQDLKNRQNSTDTLSADTKAWFSLAQCNVETLTADLYKQALERGIAKECARFLLPMSTKTTLYMSGTVRSWVHYLELRCDVATQKEHRDIAISIRDNIFSPNFPNVAAALNW